MMDSLEEWYFEFSVSAPEPIPYRMMDDLMWLEAVAWAESHQLGIGGGFRPEARRIVQSDQLWHFSFGLCVQEGGRLIPMSEASELFDLLDSWCKAHCYSLEGSFQSFPPEGAV